PFFLSPGCQDIILPLSVLCTGLLLRISIYVLASLFTISWLSVILIKGIFRGFRLNVIELLLCLMVLAIIILLLFNIRKKIENVPARLKISNFLSAVIFG